MMSHTDTYEVILAPKTGVLVTLGHMAREQQVHIKGDGIELQGRLQGWREKEGNATALFLITDAGRRVVLRAADADAPFVVTTPA